MKQYKFNTEKLSKIIKEVYSTEVSMFCLELDYQSFTKENLDRIVEVIKEIIETPVKDEVFESNEKIDISSGLLIDGSKEIMNIYKEIKDIERILIVSSKSQLDEIGYNELKQQILCRIDEMYKLQEQISNIDNNSKSNINNNWLDEKELLFQYIPKERIV